MRRVAVAVFILALVALALAPWAVVGLRSRPLLPDDLRLARQYYESTVEAAQDSTIAAIRQATSVPTIRIIGTLAGTAAATPSATTTPTTTLQTIVIVVQSTLPATAPATPALLQPPPTAGAASATPTPVAILGPPTPANMIDVADVITAAALAEQIRRDAAGGALPELTLQISPDGISATSAVAIFPGVAAQIEAGGTLAVANDSLVFRATFVRLDGEDVTARYGPILEGRINTSLYRLLSERYVQSFELAAGEIRVASRVRP